MSVRLGSSSREPLPSGRRYPVCLWESWALVSVSLGWIASVSPTVTVELTTALTCK